MDYIMVDLAAATMVISCATHLEVDLNTSDHLPLSVVTDCKALASRNCEVLN